MSARRRSGGGFHGFVAFIRRLIDAFRGGRDGGRSGGGRDGRGRQQPQCPACHRFVPALCTTAEEGAEPCGYGIVCCCPGEHRAERGAARGDEATAAAAESGKFKTSVQAAGE